MGKENSTIIKSSLMEFAVLRGTNKTFCPSEVARALYQPEWRSKMSLIRSIADTMVASGELIVMQKGMVCDKLPSQLIGPIRLRLK